MVGGGFGAVCALEGGGWGAGAGGVAGAKSHRAVVCCVWARAFVLGLINLRPLCLECAKVRVSLKSGVG